MSTDAARWERIKALFQETFDREPAERAAFLDTACGGDADLRAAVEDLLDGHARGNAFLAAPLLAFASNRTGDADTAPQSVPARIGQYRVIRELGHGGMGAVYLAERDDPDLRKTVAIKVVQRDSHFMLRRFRTESQILAALEHPGIARLYDGGTTDEGLPYFVMEYVAGENIVAYCDTHGLTIARRLQLFRRVCDAVQYAHQSFIVHRDLKPSNILVTGDGEPKLLDFGIAKLLHPELAGGPVEETMEMTRLLTPQYASPEHVRGQPMTTASDVYSLGVILYELLCGARPYRITSRQSTAEIERVVCEEDPPAPSTVAPSDIRRSLRGDLDNIVLKALRKDAAQRYGIAAQLADDVRRHLEGFPVHARPDRFGYKTGKFARRHSTAVTAAAVAVLSLMVGLGVAIWQARVARAERDHARSEADKARQIATFLGNIFQGSNPLQSRGTTPTTRDLLDRGTASIEADLKDQPDIEASLLLVMSSAYDRASVPAKALELAEQAQTLRERLFPAESVEVAESAFAVGVQLRRLGRPAAALPYLEHALSIREKRFGPSNRAVAESLSQLALTRTSLGQTAGTRELLERAIGIEEQLEPQSALQAYLYNALGQVLERHGDWAAARGAYERSIALYDAGRDAENSGNVAMPLENLGVLLTKQEEFVTAERVFDRVLLLENSFGAESAGGAYTLGCMGELARAEGDLRRASGLVERGLDMFAKLVPPDHIYLAELSTYLARTLVDEGRAAEAVRRLENALRISEKAYGAEHPDVAEVLIDLARALMLASGPSASEPLLRRALAIQRRTLPADHPSLVRTLTALGELTAASDPPASKALLEEAVLIARRGLPEKHSQRVAAEAALRGLSR